MLSQGTLRRILCLIFVPAFILVTVFVARSGVYDKLPDLDSLSAKDPTPPGEKPKPLRKHPSLDPPPPPITDNFPLAAKARSSSDIPTIPPWNMPPSPHANISTPLFIGFTRNWRLLQQTVVSYITAGWPPEDIYVVENTGVMHSNLKGQLSLQNPFYIDHYRLTEVFGINVLRTPTLFTFAQLQNFYTYTSLDNGWDHYFWAHMDTIVISDEEIPVSPSEPYKSLYTRAVEVLRETLDPNWGPLAMRWFAYDRLALVRTQSFVDVGGWDTQIPFYMTDCDMHERLWMRGFKIEEAMAGKVWDVANSLDDLALLYNRGEEDPQKAAPAAPEASIKEKRRDSAATTDDDDSSHSQSSSSKSSAPSWSPTQLSSPLYHALLRQLDDLQNAKSSNPSGRNTWQSRQRGGKGEPFYRDPDGFERGVWLWMDFGRKVFEEKWGRGPCDIRDAGLVEEDAWQVIAEWENEKARKEWDAERRRREREETARAKEEKKEGR